MRAVRCDACGAKAMIAAAKCPSCGHLFELRDGFGELLPLSYCSSCSSFYPESAGSCRWCGTQPERPPIDGKILRKVGIGIAAVVGSVFVIQNAASKGERPVVPRPKTVAVEKKATQQPTAPLDSDIAMARAMLATNDSLASRPAPDSASKTTPPAVVEQVAIAPVATAPLPVASTPAPVAAKAPQPKRVVSRWVRSVSRHWVTVRSGASKEARIIASIGPNSRVELGESRGDWRRIRAKGINGWVEPRSSFEVASAR